jgi:alpha-galactosidase/6-phospho-beta-glucosidase family protein
MVQGPRTVAPLDRGFVPNIFPQNIATEIPFMVHSGGTNPSCTMPTMPRKIQHTFDNFSNVL